MFPVVLALIALGAACSVRPAPSARPRVANDRGIPVCAAAATDDLLSYHALQCWFASPNGRWRTLGYQQVHSVLVVQVAATDVGDAEIIAQGFAIAAANRRFAELLIYVEPEIPAAGQTIRRVQWTPAGGIAVMNFPADGTVVR